MKNRLSDLAARHSPYLRQGTLFRMTAEELESLTTVSLYEHLGEKGTYTRKRGLDRETNKLLLLKHLENYREAGCRLKELNQVLPDLTRRQVQGLLRELRSEGHVYSIGQTNAGRWYPGPLPG